MNIIDRYLIRAALQGVGIMIMVMIALSGFVNFVGELDDIGRGSYQLIDAGIFTALTLPSQIYSAMPIIALIGGLVGLGSLATNSELAVIRLSGASVARLAGSTLVAGLILAILAASLGEFIAPPLEQAARQFRTLKRSDTINLAGSDTAVWMREDDDIISVDQMMSEGVIGGVFIYGFDDARRLVSLTRADGASLSADGEWYLENVRRTDLSGDTIVSSSEQQRVQPGSLSPELLELSAIDPDNLSARGLYEYYRYLKSNGLESNRYEQAFWTRLATAVSVPLMMLLALPFVLGPMQRSGIGARLVAGIVIGFAYRLASQSLFHAGGAFGLEPLVVGWAPVLVLAVLVAVGLSRVR